MALSQRKTTIAVLRGLLGEYHGREDHFARLAERSRSWVKKVSAGLIKLSEDSARQISLQTGVSLDWLMGPIERPPVDISGNPYDSSSFAFFRANPTHTLVTTAFIPRVIGVASAAGDQSKLALFQWRFGSFLDECAEEFGVDARAYKTADDALQGSPLLRDLAMTDAGMDVPIVDHDALTSLAQAAVEGKRLGKNCKVTIKTWPNAATKKKKG
ncbi:MAG: hypothetical protein H0W20_12345 [Chthoniobacterales bacterium]|nr:hypothetical protein [Chthoniobacterales bacterium]